MITNEWIPGTGDLSEPLAVRRAVFVNEQHVPESVEQDENDRLSMHLVIHDGGRPVATGRIWHDGRVFRIGRCAVVPDQRGQGIGDLLVKLLLLKVFEYMPSKVALHAQEHARGFYGRYGFRPVGEPFLEGGIEHIEMEVTPDEVAFPSGCGKTQHLEDFYPDATGA